MSESIHTDTVADFLSHHTPVQAPPLFVIGTVLGTWRIVAFIARGGSAEVYRAEHISQKIVVAIKVLVRDDAIHRVRFQLEAELLQHHPSHYFPAFYEYVASAQHPYIVEEFLFPISLPSVETEVAKYICQVAAAVKYLHSLGFAHRDVKPHNVLARKDGSLVLADFGLVKKFSSAAVPRVNSLSVVGGKQVGVGTPRYAAPEQFAGGDVTPATDIHALGILVDECFASHPPRTWREIIRGATSSLPVERYKDAGEFIVAVQHRHRIRHLVVAAFCVTVLAVMSFMWQTFGREEYELWRISENMVTNSVPARIIYLGGRTNVFTRAINLSAARPTYVCGPGILDATLVSKDAGAQLHLDRCMVRNRSTVPVKDANIQYYFGTNVYLNFVAQKEPFSPSWRACLHEFDGEFNDVRFMGPETWKDLRRARYDELRLQLDQ